MKDIYIVLSQTGTVLSRIIKLLTGAQYCHASISLSDDLSIMYSFGRINPYNPFYGGYVKESPSFGTFKRFYNTKIAVLKFSVENVKYSQIQYCLQEMYANKGDYGYNYIGLFDAMFKIYHIRKNKFYCSEFVNYIFKKYEIYDCTSLPKPMKPIDFYKAFENRVVFRGKLTDFCKTTDKMIDKQ